MGSAPANRDSFLPFFYKLNLTNKILASTVVLLLLFGLLGMVVLQRVLRSRMASEVADSSSMLAAATAAHASSMFDDRDALVRLVRETEQVDETISYVMVVGAEGDVLAHTFSWDPPDAVLVRHDAPSPVGSPDVLRVELQGETYLDVAAPIVDGSRGQGIVQIGTSMVRIDGFIQDLGLVVLLYLASLLLLAMIAARSLFNHVTRPVVELTHLADEVSIGNLDVRFDFGVPVRCWEIKQCGRTDCAAYENKAVQCWFVDGTPCEGYEPRFPQKLVGCRTCEVYRAHKGDEIVQLADSFRHMTQVLGTSQLDLQRSDRFQRSLIRNSFDGIIATDETDTVRIFNRVAQSLSGYSEADVVGKMTWDELFAAQMCDELESPLFRDGTRVISGFYRKEMKLLGKDESTIDVLASGITLLDDDESEVGKVFFFKDMREINQLREDLVRSGRLAATGQTVASISHSIKNILDGLRGGVYVYKRGARVGKDEIRDEGWSMVERNVDLISALVADLLNFAKDRQPDLRSCDPNDLASDVVRTMEPRARQLGVELQLELNPLVHDARLDSHAVHQCLTNLVSNGLDAAATVENGWVAIATGLDEDGALTFEVRDNGPGVTPRIREGLFLSMVSSKGSKGTGLGLLVVQKVVSEHGGDVIYLADAAPGATFRIVLPVQ